MAGRAVTGQGRRGKRSAPLRPLSRQRRTMRAVTVAEAIELWRAVLPATISSAGRPLSVQSVRTYDNQVRAFGRWCAVEALVDLTGEQIGQWLAERTSEGLARNSVALGQVVVSLWLGWCVERGLLTRSPLERMSRLKREEPPITVFTEEECRRLLRACNQRTWLGSRNHAMLALLLATGLRAAELCSLCVSDYAPSDGAMLVAHGKGNKRRIVGVPQSAAASLRSWLSLFHDGPADGPLFPSSAQAGGHLTTAALRSLLRSLERRSGVAGVHPHTFRHTFAVAYLREGGDLYTLSRLLGHASVSQTERYLRGMRDEQVVAQHLAVLRAVR
jgi:site-specific recombinase XerD